MAPVSVTLNEKPLMPLAAEPLAVTVYVVSVPTQPMSNASPAPAGLSATPHVVPPATVTYRRLSMKYFSICARKSPSLVVPSMILLRVMYSLYDGSAMAARMPTITTTIITSISVKPAGGRAEVRGFGMETPMGTMPW